MMATVQKGTSCCTFWSLSRLSTTIIKASVIPWNIVNLRYLFDLWPWPLTLIGKFATKYQSGTDVWISCKVSCLYLEKCGIWSFFAFYVSLTPAVTLTVQFSKSHINRCRGLDLPDMRAKYCKNRKNTFWVIACQLKTNDLTPVTLTFDLNLWKSNNL